MPRTGRRVRRGGVQFRFVGGVDGRRTRSRGRGRASVECQGRMHDDRRVPFAEHGFERWWDGIDPPPTTDGSGRRIRRRRRDGRRRAAGHERPVPPIVRPAHAAGAARPPPPPLVHRFGHERDVVDTAPALDDTRRLHRDVRTAAVEFEDRVPHRRPARVAHGTGRGRPALLHGQLRLRSRLARERRRGSLHPVRAECQQSPPEFAHRDTMAAWEGERRVR